MKKLFLIGASALLASISIFSAEHEMDTCSLTKPPAGSRVRATHAGDLTTFPASVPPRYTGCRVTWLENGHRLATVRFDLGRVRSVELQEPDMPEAKCVFSTNGALEQGPADACANRDAWNK
ncbi:hypothetical protein ACSFA8_26760 [Variovorax sp. RT4R15]|uniref:hypothetical protein n=1 Tax=Variovorax sp. RT4R15 TaxID=3443737 RepID=UPI003F453DCE